MLPIEKARGRGVLLVRKFDAGGKYEGLSLSHNQWVVDGIDEIFLLIAGVGGAPWNAADSRIGIGDNNTPANDGQSDLIAPVNKTYMGMDPTYPKPGAPKAFQWRATFGPADANYDWQEFVLKNAVSGLIVNRGVGFLGTKVAGATWIATLTLSLA